MGGEQQFKPDFKLKRVSFDFKHAIIFYEKELMIEIGARFYAIKLNYL